MLSMNKVIYSCLLLLPFTPVNAADLSAGNQQMAGSCAAYNVIMSNMMANSNDQKLKASFGTTAKFLDQYQDRNNPALFVNSFNSTMAEAKRTQDMANNLRDQNMYPNWLSKALDKCATFIQTAK